MGDFREDASYQQDESVIYKHHSDMQGDDVQDRKRCRAINTFFPILIVAYVGMSLLFGIVASRCGLVLPVWSQYIVSQAFVLIPAVLYMVIFREHFPKEISYKPLKPLDALLSVLTGYALIPMVLFIGNITMLFATNYLQESATDLTQYPFFVQLVVIAVVPPIVEEFVFRGLFFHTYRKMGIIAGAIASGLIFGLFHLNINQFCYAMVMGFVFAYMVEATGSMWSSMLAHFAVNTYSIGILALMKYLSAHSTQFAEQYSAAQDMATNLSAAAILSQLVTLGGAAACFLFFAILMIRKMAKRNGRLEHMKIFGNKNVNLNPRGGFKKIISVPAIITAVFCVIYMIVIEFN